MTKEELALQAEPEIRKRAEKAADELLSFLDISYPRNTKYAIRYSIRLRDTITICITENMMGRHRT